MNCSPVLLPSTSVIEFTAACNMRCVFCPIGHGVIPREGKMMADDTFDKVVREIRPCVDYVYIGGYGEMLLHPRFAPWVKTLKAFAKLNLATNLTVLAKENLEVLCLIDDLSVSISGGDAADYRAVHGRDYFDIVRANLGRLREMRQGKVDITYVETALNPNIEWAREALGEFDPKPLALPLRETMRWLLPKNGSPRFTTEHGNIQLRADIRRCREMWNVIYFLADGKVTFCCYDFANEGRLGNIRDHTLEEIWNGEAYQSLRANHRAGNFHEVCQTQCSMPFNE